MSAPAQAWLERHAEALDIGEPEPALQLLPWLGAQGLLRIGVPGPLGGDGGTLEDAVQAIAGVARASLTAAFVFWAQRAFIEYLLHSPNEGLRERRLGALLEGRRAGATGLSNAMKFLSGIERLGVRARGGDAPWRLDGALPWATNLAPAGFDIALAVDRGEGLPPAVVALPSERAGLLRSADLDLIALRGSHTASLRLDGVEADASDLIHPIAGQYLPRVRPAFLSLQCGLSLGLAQEALARAAERLGPARAVLAQPLDEASTALQQHRDALLQGLADGRFAAQPAALFRLRIALAQDVQQALQLELLASGGRAYHRDPSLGFARRWREAAFIPIVTPSISQLQGELARQAQAQAAA